MSIPNSTRALFLGAAGQSGGESGYLIERSLRFNSADSAYLSRTPASAGNRRTWTWAGWVKRSALGTDQEIFATASGDLVGFIRFTSGNLLRVFSRNASAVTQYDVSTVAVFRDASAWYHIAVAQDTTQGSSGDRIKVYVNGALQTLTTATAASLNADCAINGTTAHNIGNQPSASVYLSAYLADVHLIDGQQLTPSSFGEFDANNIWQPKAYTGTYPGNSFHLPFSDNSTAAALGKDAAGSNNWTPNNFLVGVATPSLSTFLAGSNTSTNTSTTLAEVNKAFDNNVSTFFGFSSGGFSPDQIKQWTFTNGYPLNAGDRLSMTGVNGEGFAPSITLANGQVLSSVTTALTVSSNTRISRISAGGFGTAGQYGNINSISVNGIPLVLTADNDSLVDSPVNGSQVDTGAGGEVRGNYATWNPLLMNSGYMVATNGNLDATCQNSNYNPAALNIHVRVGGSSKWYCEFSFSATPQTNFMGFGLAVETSSIFGTNQIPGSIYMPNGQKSINGTKTTYGNSYVSGDIIGVAIDETTGALTCYKNGVSQGLLTTLSTGSYQFIGLNYGIGTVMTVNAGQRPFAYTAPSGFKALCTANLPTPTGVVAQPSTAMDVKLYTGNGSTQTISGLGFSPDLVWIKCRVGTRNHVLSDIIRGTNNVLASNTTSAQVSPAVNGQVSAFNSDGFSVAAGTSDALETNNLNDTYAAWCWDAGSSTVTNTQGSITSQVRANASAGFSVVTATLNGTAHTVGHGLNAAPSLIILKRRDATAGWPVYHRSLGSTQLIELNSTSAASANSGVWNNTNPTSTVFTVGNAHSGNYVAYCFAPVAGYSSFGSYTGNGSSDGPFVYTGFRPRFLLVKRSDAAGEPWVIHDAARDSYNGYSVELYPNNSNAEGGPYTPPIFDFLSNGFKIRSGSATAVNGSGGTFIYAAFAESPFQFARAR